MVRAFMGQVTGPGSGQGHAERTVNMPGKGMGRVDVQSGVGKVHPDQPVKCAGPWGLYHVVCRGRITGGF